MNMKEGKFVATRSKKTIPLAHSLLSAGDPAEVENDYELFDVNDFVTGGKEGMISYTVTGDSMVEEIKPGYKVIVDPYREAVNGDIVVSRVNGKNNVKIFETSRNGLFLVPKNKKYPPRRITVKDDFMVLGVVVAHIGLHRK